MNLLKTSTILLFAMVWGTAYPQTVFDPGDIMVLAVNANDGSCSGGKDIVSFVCFKDLENGTTIDFTDNGWERLHLGYWGTTEGVLRLTRTGGTIAAGTVITVEFNNTNIIGISPDNNWSNISLNGGFNNLDLNNSGDQLFVMQGGSWSTSGTHWGTYTGTVLFGFSTSGSWATYTGLNLGTEQSVVYPNMFCLSMAPTSTSDWSKYTGPFTPATQRVWIDRVNNMANWTAYGNCAAYNAATPNYQSGYTINIIFAGFREGYWQGSVDNDWFDCNNWENMMLPTADTDVLLRPLNGSTGPFNHASINASMAYAKSISIEPGAQLNIIASGELTVYEDFKNNGAFNSAGHLQFQGNVNSVLYGDQEIENYILTIDKSGGAVVQTDTLITILDNGTMHFFSGVVYPLSGDLITFKNNAAAMGPHAGSYVEGLVRKEGNQDFVFPVGDGFFQPIGIEDIAAPNSIFEAEFIDANGPGAYNYFWVPTIDHVATCSYWMLDRIQGGVARVMLSWDNDPDCGVTDPANLVVSRFDGTLWQNHGQLSYVGNTSWGYLLSADLINNFSPFALASIGPGNPLPVEWLSFEAEADESGNVVLKWTTASETNNDYFSVEHSPDGAEFSQIATLPGAGSSSALNTYEWIHKTPSLGNNYYRIRQIDFDGGDDYSKIRFVSLSNNREVLFERYGNSLNVINPGFEGVFNFTLTDVFGRVVEHRILQSNDDLTIDLTPYASGIYIVNLTSSTSSLSTRIFR